MTMLIQHLIQQYLQSVAVRMIWVQSIWLLLPPVVISEARIITLSMIKTKGPPATDDETIPRSVSSRLQCAAVFSIYKRSQTVHGWFVKIVIDEILCGFEKNISDEKIINSHEQNALSHDVWVVKAVEESLSNNVPVSTLTMRSAGTEMTTHSNRDSVRTSPIKMSEYGTVKYTG